MPVRCPPLPPPPPLIIHDDDDDGQQQQQQQILSLNWLDWIRWWTDGKKTFFFFLKYQEKTGLLHTHEYTWNICDGWWCFFLYSLALIFLINDQWWNGMNFFLLEIFQEKQKKFFFVIFCFTNIERFMM